MECGKPWALVCGSSSVAKIFTCDDTWSQVQGDRDVPVGAMSLAFEKSGENIKYQDHRIGRLLLSTMDALKRVKKVTASDQPPI